MRQFELDDLKALLRECAGEEEGVDLDGDVVDVPFAELGYDSLAILQTTGRIERDFDVALDEEALDEADTPRAYLELVNRALAAVRAAA
ncbi:MULTISPECIES: acyl carrier protein [Streptomyces]|uniref:acyl carrier protein n=1 Tax=Streptomyces TaxID=1883 RepID=UPI001E4C85A5|nr:acyl carrier protein [Streptomyces sp. DH20]MCP9994219.1 acyl carrier protein [Streptomyces albogriseolus]